MPYFKGLITNGGSLTTTTSYQDIPNLSFSLNAGGTYTFNAYFLHQGNSAGAVFQPTMGGTATATLVVYRCSIQTNVNGASNSQVQNSLASPATPGGSAVNATATNYGVEIDGMIVVNAAGTLTVQAKHATAACAVQSGGRFMLQQIA